MICRRRLVSSATAATMPGLSPRRDTHHPHAHDQGKAKAAGWSDTFHRSSKRNNDSSRSATFHPGSGCDDRLRAHHTETAVGT
jgi:hypothetical protein